jgi:hypothetical protein
MTVQSAIPPFEHRAHQEYPAALHPPPRGAFCGPKYDSTFGTGAENFPETPTSNLTATSEGATRSQGVDETAGSKGVDLGAQHIDNLEVGMA